MPIYNYKCVACGHEFTAMQKYDDPAPTCPREQEMQVKRIDSEEAVGVVVACGAPTERFIGRSNFQLKGSGWYKTDYAD